MNKKHDVFDKKLFEVKKVQYSKDQDRKEKNNKKRKRERDHNILLT
jgi:hypothetical protein